MRMGYRSRAWGSLAAAAALVLSAQSIAVAPGDTLFERDDVMSAIPTTVFPHWRHRIHYRCYVCHPALFPLKKVGGMTMTQINRGESCGQCHNGVAAFDAGFQNCSRCHPAFGSRTEP